MKSPVFATASCASFSGLRAPVFGSLMVGISLALVQPAPAQIAQPQPTAASTPVVAPSPTPGATPSPTPAATPSPSPTATPYPSATPNPTATPTDSPTPVPSTTPTGGGSPSLTIVPGLPSAADMDVYNVARTPQISIALTTATNPGGMKSTSTTSSSAAPAALRPSIKGGVCSLITLQPAASGRVKSSSTSATSATSASQPVATVTLTYSGSTSGQRVWVQALRVGGTLTATDNAGHIYDGSQGFYLTLGANGTATFSYQAPNLSGTYQVLTRYTNVKTVLPFVVPDPAP